MTFRLTRFVLAILLLAGGFTASAQPLPVAGRDYLLLSPPRATASGAAIEVIEFFYYGCPVCYESQPHIDRWRAAAPADVRHVRVPTANFESAESFALTYYALEASGQLERLHGAVYENHHFDDQRLNDETKLLDWLARNGVDADAFRVHRVSSENRIRVAEAKRTYERYGVRAVPTFVVDGKYLTSAGLAGGVREMMDVVAYLVDRARAERRGR